ncbi:MAG TPA: VWA domain-containing protein [Vicinamibacteria bacterium]|nr:VWA domain-containing protein [Vicinamibacteria bacterium]
MTLCPALLLGLASILSLTPGSPAQEDGRGDIPTFRTGVSTVLVDALVLDGEGNPIADLDKADFEVLEDGIPQTISSFDVTSWTSYVAERTESSPAASANAYPRRFVFILNRQAAQFTYLARAKKALSSFVVESMADGDEAMVIDVGYATKVIQELQPVKEVTLEAIRTLSQMEVDYMMDPYRSSFQLYRDIESLSRSLAELPGRKIVVLLSPELPTFSPPGSRYSDQGLALKDAIEALNEANASVYTIDLYGADGSWRGGSYGGLSPLATETGGRFFPNTVSFEPSLRRIGRENERYYLLGYTPDQEPDGRYRKIEVRVRTRPDAEVIARSGYMARVSASEATDSPEVARLEELPLAVEITTYLLPTGAGIVRVPMSVALPEDLLTGDGGDSRRLDLRVTNDGGEVLHTFERDVSVERYFVLSYADLVPGRYVLSVVLHSEERELYRTSMGIDVPEGLGRRFGISSVVPIVGPGASIDSDELPILPTASVKRGQDAFVLFQVFPGQDEPARRARVSYTLFGERSEALRTGGPEAPIELLETAAGTPVILSVPTSSLAYGRYRVEVRAEDDSRGRRATSDIEIRIR